MNTSEILELVRAGYTKSEIESLSGEKTHEDNPETKKQEETKTKEIKTEEVKQEETKTKEIKTEEVKQEQKTDNSYKDLLEAVNSLKETVKAMQADNAKKASGDQPHKETAESAIKSFFEDMPKN